MSRRPVRWGSVFDVVRDPQVLHRIEVQGGVLERECQQLLRDFFGELRQDPDLDSGRGIR